MAEIPFDRLIEIYSNTAFDPDGERGTLTIATAAILEDLVTLDRDEEAGRAANIALVDDESGERRVGDGVQILAGAPSLRSGILARDVDTLLRSPRAFIEEPRAFFIVAGAVSRTSSPAPAVLSAYRQVLDIVGLLTKAAAFLDPIRQELVFVHAGKMPVPVRYDAVALHAMATSDAQALVALFRDDVHEDQRLSILAATIVATCSAQPADRRFRFLLENLETIVREVRDGYRLYASEFTYAKIRRDVETAQFDYLGKIHKTFTDIQGQLLGIPVATIVVASQLKVASACGPDLWTDLAVVGGAWVFVVLVAVAIANQRLTLKAIKGEVGHQRSRLDGEYAPIADKFADIFNTLDDRIRLHRIGLLAFAAVALCGAALATLAAWQVVDVNVWTCLSAPPATTPSSTPVPTRAFPSPTAAPAAPPTPMAVHPPSAPRTP